MRHYAEYDDTGKLVAIGIGLNGVEISETEYNALLAKIREKIAYVEKLYAGEITADDVPEAWREEVQANVELLKAVDEEAAQEISGDEFMAMIEGVL